MSKVSFIGLGVMGLLKYLPHQGNMHANGGYAYYSHVKVNRFLGHKPTYPNPEADEDKNRIIITINE